jgi:hypothetical protein
VRVTERSGSNGLLSSHNKVATLSSDVVAEHGGEVRVPIVGQERAQVPDRARPGRLRPGLALARHHWLRLSEARLR